MSSSTDYTITLMEKIRNILGVVLSPGHPSPPFTVKLELCIRFSYPVRLFSWWGPGRGGGDTYL